MQRNKVERALEKDSSENTVQEVKRNADGEEHVTATMTNNG